MAVNRAVLAPNKGGRVLVLAVLLFLSILALTPLIWMVMTAIKPPSLAVEFPPSITWPVFTNFAELFDRSYLLRWTINSAIVAITVSALELFFCSLAGYSFAKLHFRGRELLFWLYIGSMMVPGQVTLVPLFILLSKLGWTDTFAGLIVPFASTPFGVFLMRQQMQTLPSDLMDAGRIDGCSEFGIFRRIVLPLSKPGLAVLGIFTFVGQWNSFLWPLVVTNSTTMRTLQVGLAMLQEEVPMSYGLLMAGATYAAIPIVVLFLVFQPYFLQGVRIGALKE